MHSGGLVWIELLAIIVYSPWSRKYLPMAFISSDVPLNGVSGVHGSRDADEVEDPEQAEVAVRADARVLGGQPLVVLAHPRAEARGVVDEAVLLVDPDRRQRGGQRDRVATSRSGRRRTSSCSNASAMSWRIATAPSGRYDDVRPLAIVIRSGTTSQWSTANQRPVRPKPAMTSSQTIRMSWRSQSSRTPWR